MPDAGAPEIPLTIEMINAGLEALTQIIAELFRINQYDGIAFTSQFDPDGFNVALFDPNDAQQTECHVYRTTSVKYNFTGPWGGYSD